MANKRIDFEDVESVNVDALNNLSNELMKKIPLKFRGENGEIIEANNFDDFDRLMSEGSSTLVFF